MSKHRKNHTKRDVTEEKITNYNKKEMAEYEKTIEYDYKEMVNTAMGVRELSKNENYPEEMKKYLYAESIAILEAANLAKEYNKGIETIFYTYKSLEEKGIELNFEIILEKDNLEEIYDKEILPIVLELKKTSIRCREIERRLKEIGFID